MRAFDRPSLQTARLTLRPLLEADVPALFAMHSDPQAMRYWSGTVWPDDSRGRAMVARDHDPAATDHLRLGIAFSATGALVGTCTFFQINPQCRRAEMGYMLARQGWGQGLMQEALRAFIAHGFDALNLHRIEADTDPRNARSMQLLQRLGFVQEGHFRERWIVDGEVSDSAMFGLLQRDWASA
jgi:RimJ/RimL family protein N-acetyltransferase